MLDKNKILKIVKSKKWNIQGFNARPLYLVSAATDSGWLVKKEFRKGYTHFFYFFIKGRAYMYYDEADWNSICEAYFKKVSSVKDLKKLIVDYKKRYRNLVKQTNYKVDDLEGFSKRKLISLVRLLSKRLSDAVGIAHAIEGITFGSEKKLRSIFESKGIISEREFGLICSPIHPSFLLEVQKKLWTIKNLKGKAQDKAINAFIKKYGWIENTYLGAKKFSRQDVLNRANELKLKPIFNNNISLQKKKILNCYNLSKKENFIISTVELCFHWQDERKKYILQTIHQLDPVVKAIAERFSIDADKIKFMTPQEITEQNLSSAKFREQLEKREKKSVYYSTPGKNYIFTGGGYDFFSNGLRVAMEDNADGLKGIVASPGRVTGIVKICESVSDIEKVQQGEIIVASMTRPEYLPAMQKAAAFVTDEGGLTCHAAIIAREMKKPCIVGTKIATKILHDGDRVEVDANKGIIKIIHPVK